MGGGAEWKFEREIIGRGEALSPIGLPTRGQEQRQERRSQATQGTVIPADINLLAQVLGGEPLPGLHDEAGRRLDAFHVGRRGREGGRQKTEFPKGGILE